MKPVVLILSILLSFLFGGKTDAVSTGGATDTPYCVSESPSPDKTADCPLNREFCISAVQGYSFAGNNSTNSVSGRTQPGRRIQPQIRSSFRMVKDGKVVDNNHLHPFLARSIVHLAGILIPERYLFSICRLRL